MPDKDKLLIELGKLIELRSILMDNLNITIKIPLATVDVVHDNPALCELYEKYFVNEQNPSRIDQFLEEYPLKIQEVFNKALYVHFFRFIDLDISRIKLTLNKKYGII